MAKAMKKAKKAGPKKPRPKIAPARQRRLSEIDRFNESFFAERKRMIKHLRKLLQEPRGCLDPATRSVAIKFSRLLFVYINDCCEGHFYRKERRKTIPVEKIKSNERVYFETADFEILYGLFRESSEFFQALKAMEKKNPFVSVTDAGDIILVAAKPGFKVPERVTKAQALKLREANLECIRAFEGVVDRFVEKYGVKSNLS